MTMENTDSAFVAALRKRVEEARRLHAEFAKYQDWLGTEAKDCQINFRIGREDLMKFKSLARAKNMRYQTYLREIVRREIMLEEEYGAGIMPVRNRGRH
jgi:predicted DNA binding CopG/RHH family protein